MKILAISLALIAAATHSPEPVVHEASLNWPVARTSDESAFTSSDTPCGQVISIPTDGPCRSRPPWRLGRKTTTVLRLCSTLAWATASSPAALSGVSSTVVVSVSAAVIVTWPAPVRITSVVSPSFFCRNVKLTAAPRVCGA